MTKQDKQKQEEENIDESNKKTVSSKENNSQETLQKTSKDISDGDLKCREMLSRITADFDNFKKRVDRDKIDMSFYLKQDMLKKILPRLDDLERVLKNTPKDLRENPLFEGVLSIRSKLISDLDKMGVKPLVSIGNPVDPEKHEVMSVVKGKKLGIIFDEFERGYMLGDRVLRCAKVVVGG